VEPRDLLLPLAPELGADVARGAGLAAEVAMGAGADAAGGGLLAAGAGRVARGGPSELAVRCETGGVALTGLVLAGGAFTLAWAAVAPVGAGLARRVAGTGGAAFGAAATGAAFGAED
jgi:hypothetical protein